MVLKVTASEFLVWRESKTILGEHIRRGKDCVFKIINDSAGLVFDVLSRRGAKGGSSTNGNQGRCFFSEKVIEALKRCVGKKYIIVLQLHCLISAIARFASSKIVVLSSIVHEMCLESNFLVAEKFPWARKNHTLMDFFTIQLNL